jgi:hypothetical protein
MERDEYEADLNIAVRGRYGSGQAHARLLVSDAEQRARITALEKALRQLRGWDMLTLTADGHGYATGDAPWACALIDKALSGLPVTPTDAETRSTDGKALVYNEATNTSSFVPSGVCTTCPDCYESSAVVPMRDGFHCNDCNLWFSAECVGEDTQ